MQHTQEQNTFLEMIKGQIIRSSMNAKVTPSVMAALAISISSWNTDPVTVFSRNLYKYRVNKGKTTYNGKCYSKDSGKIYNSVDECDEVGAILYRAYDTYEEGINDWIHGLVNKRRSLDGPLRYQSIIGCAEYKETIDRLVRNGFMQDFLNKADDIEYIQNLIYLIEEYKLYEWDEELKKSLEVESMSKKKRSITFANGTATEENNNDVDIQEEEMLEEEDDIVEEEVVEEKEKFVPIDMYRVRKSWEESDTQVFASPNFEDAKEECLKHKGYKIFNEDGTLKEDPFAPTEKELAAMSGKAVEVIIPTAGGEINLVKEPVFLNALSQKAYKYATGLFYFFDNTVINGRAKITMSKEAAEKRDHSKVYGCIDISK